MGYNRRVMEHLSNFNTHVMVLDSSYNPDIGYIKYLFRLLHYVNPERWSI